MVTHYKIPEDIRAFLIGFLEGDSGTPMASRRDFSSRRYSEYKNGHELGEGGDYNTLLAVLARLIMSTE
jgi:hypothetical protein